MRIRRCASRLLGSDYSSAPAPPPFELPLPPPTPSPPPPPVLQPCSSAHAGGGGGLPSSSAEPACGNNRSPWDLMAQLDPSDPQELELFMETYFVSVTYRASWLFLTSIPAARIKEEEEEEEVDMAVDMVDEVNDMPWHKVAKRKAAKKAFTENRDEEKNVSRPKKKAKVNTREDEEDGMADGGELWMCKKNDGKTWFCRRTVSQPDSYCLYHSDPKRVPQRPASSAASKPSGSSKPRRRRALDVGEGFYYYAGFGPSRSKRQCRPSSSVIEYPPAEEKEEASAEEKEEASAKPKEEASAKQKEEASAKQKEEAPAEQKEEAFTEQKEEALPKEHADPTTAEPQADDADNQVASGHIDDPKYDDTAGIAGCDEESSDDTLGWNSEPRVVGVNGGIKRKSPFKKRWRKPVKARSLKSLMT